MDLQKASMWKRISAGLFDGILLGMLAVGLAWLLSLVLGYDSHQQNWQAACDRYGQAYGVDFEISGEAYDLLPSEEKQTYDAAYAALIADDAAMHAYNMIVNLSQVMIACGIGLAMLLLEFVVPLLFQNGRTLGKVIFGIGLMRIDGVKISGVQLFVRTILGKFTLETMIPVYIGEMILFGTMGLEGTLFVGALLLIQLIMLVVSRENALIHDKLSSTVVIDFASQRIFDTKEAQIEHIKQIQAEEAKKQTY